MNMKRLIVALFLAFLFIGLQTGCRHGLAVKIPADRFYSVTTDDGWTLKAARYKPASPKPGALPIILCHGATANLYTWDLDERHGMATYLSGLGYDVWSVNLRGRDKDPEAKTDDSPTRSWTFEEMLHHDLPAWINYVRKVTGAPQVIWIGHSMGGMLMYAYLETYGDSAIHAVVTIGSPVEFTDQKANKDLAKLRFLAGALNPKHRIKLKWMARLSWPLAGLTDEMGRNTVFNPDNMPTKVREEYAYNAVSNSSVAILRELVLWADNGTCFAPDGSMNYTKELGRVKVPVLMIAGAMDKLGTPKSVTHAFDSVSSEDKTLRIYSRANGDSFDYGHLDLIVGEKAPQEVYPVISDWVDAHQTR